MKKKNAASIQNIFISLSTSLIILIVLILLFRPKYETNDDSGLISFISGAKGIYDGHMVYVGYFLGALEAFLYRTFPGIPVHSVLLYLFQFAAMAGIFYVCLSKKKNRSICTVILVSLVFFFFEYFIRLQYTKTSGFITVAGLFLILYAAENSGKKYLSFVLGAILVLLGFCLHPVQCIAEIGIMSSLGIYILIGLFTDSRDVIFHSLKRYMIAMAILLAGCFFMWYMNRIAYKNPQWQAYLEYNELRTELFDYGFPSYKTNKSAYEELGIDHDTYKLYKSWNFADTEFFTTDVMRKLISLKEEKVIDIEFVKGFFREIPTGILKTPSFICFLLLLCYWIIMCKHSRKDILTVIYLLLVITVLYAYLYYCGRYLYNRVDVSIWFASTIVLIWLIMDGEVRKPHFLLPSAIIMLLIILSATSGVMKKSIRTDQTKRKERKAAARMVYQKINEDPEHLYMMKAGTLSLSKCYDVFERTPYNILGNIYCVGGWPSLTPTYMNPLQKYNVSNPYGDIIDNDKVYFVDDDIDQTLTYLRSHYSDQVKAELIKTIGTHNVYRIYTN